MNRLSMKWKLWMMEQRCNDDLYLLWELGPEPFPTRELKRILPLVQLQMERVDQLRNQFYRIGALGILLLALSFLANFAGLTFVSQVLLGSFPLAFLAALAGQAYLRFRFPTYVNSMVLREAIEAELDRRRKDASIF